MRILLIAKFFPPANSIAARRLYSFAKYLPDHGIDVDVLTTKRSGNFDVDLGNIPIIYSHEETGSVNKFASKSNPLKDLAKHSGIRSFRHYLKSPFYHNAIKRFDETSMSRYDAVLASYGNEDVLRIGYYINKKFGIPLIIDYRDLWLDSHSVSWTPLDRIIIYNLERRIIKSACLVTTTTKTFAKQLTDRFHVNPHVIYNGYFDFDQTADISSPHPQNSDKIVFGYCGSLYGGLRPIHLIFPVLAANPNYRLHIALLDDYDKMLVEDLVTKFGVSDQTKIFMNLSNQQANELQQNSDYLLLINSMEKKARGVLAAKIFEYMAVGKFIIGIGSNEDEAADLIKQLNIGCYCETTIDLEQKIREISTNKTTLKADISKFNRVNQAKNLAELIKDINLTEFHS